MIGTGRRKYNRIWVCMLVLVMCICGCTNETPQPKEKPQITGLAVNPPGSYDSEDLNATVLTVDKTQKTCTFYNRTTGRNYTLAYDGTSKIYDKYGSSLVIDQIMPGDVVNVTFVKSKKLINTLSKSDTVWVYDNVENFEIDAIAKKMTINGGDYRFSDSLKIFSEGNAAEIIDINSCDRLVVSGYEHSVYSIVIDQGHGYLRLKGQNYFEGGWIEIGNKIIKTVSDDMLIPVPVGKYEVKLSNGQYEGSRSVDIKKNQETLLDVSDMVVIEEEQESTLVFVVEPAGAIIYIDGKEVDITKPVKLSFGIHQIIAKSEGYKTMTQYIKVDKESATLEFALEKTKNLTDIDSAQASPSPEAMVTTFVTEAVSADNTGYKVIIEGPEDTEVYLDGMYIGMTPISFPKREGTRVVTLRKEGYISRSYTISMDASMQDETFSFSALEEED